MVLSNPSLGIVATSNRPFNYKNSSAGHRFNSQIEKSIPGAHGLFVFKYIHIGTVDNFKVNISLTFYLFSIRVKRESHTGNFIHKCFNGKNNKQFVHSHLLNVLEFILFIKLIIISFASRLIVMKDSKKFI